MLRIARRFERVFGSPLILGPRVFTVISTRAGVRHLESCHWNKERSIGGVDHIVTVVANPARASMILDGRSRIECGAPRKTNDLRRAGRRRRSPGVIRSYQDSANASSKRAAAAVALLGTVRDPHIAGGELAGEEQDVHVIINRWPKPTVIPRASAGISLRP